ncbi:WbuC family cupin fold metalloprotein [Macellibacteroides fermentans]|uniref:WbuC family cupin fold metalloprotein n=1 Tax=Macellibacteroides fermentans TaxID=879969 RepID=UPI00352D7881
MNLLLDTQLLDTITEQAKESPRLRMNYNLHDSLEAKAQRLFNALEPGTVLPIHRHRHTAETYILVRGKMKVEYYNQNKELTDTEILDPAEGKYGLHVPAGQWHTVIPLESGTMVFEVKDGPYMPFQPEDVLT